MNDAKVNKDSEGIEKITITYENGTTKNIDKGLVITIDKEDEEIYMNMEFLKIGGKELRTIMYGCVEMLQKLGEGL